MTRQLCSISVGDYTCPNAALIAVDRGTFGERLICAWHMDEPELYADVKANGFPWRLLRDSDDPGLEQVNADAG